MCLCVYSCVLFNFYVIISTLCTYFTPSISEGTYFSHTYIYASDFEFFFFFSSLCSELLLPLPVPQAHSCAVFPGTDSCSCSVHLMCIDISAVITYLTKAICREHLPEPGVARCSLLSTLA